MPLPRGVLTPTGASSGGLLDEILFQRRAGSPGTRPSNTRLIQALAGATAADPEPEGPVGGPDVGLVTDDGSGGTEGPEGSPLDKRGLGTGDCEGRVTPDGFVMGPDCQPIGKAKRRPPGSGDDFSGAFGDQAGIDQERGNTAEQAGIDRLLGFDSGEAVTDASRAAFENLREEFNENLLNLRSSQSSIGRLQTGFGQGDEDELAEDFNTRLARAISSNALQGASLDLRAAGLLTGAGGNIVNRYLDILTGERDYSILREQLDLLEEQQGFGFGDFLGIVGEVLLGAGVGGGPGALLAGGNAIRRRT